MFRHGHRAPQVPEYNLNKWNNFGELTAVGARQAFLLGTEFRNRYITKYNLLPPKFDSSSIYIESTPVNRTIMTAYSFLAGLYPASTGPQLSQKYPLTRGIPPLNISDINLNELGYNSIPHQFQPIPVYTKPVPKCVKAKQFYDKNKQKNEEIFQKLANTFQEDILTLNKLYNTNNITIYNIPTIYDALIADYYENNDLPIEINDKFWKNLTIVHDILTYLIYYSSDETNQILATPYFTKLKDYFLKKSQEKLPQNCIVQSVHDTQIAIIIAALNITSAQCILHKFNSGQSYELECPGYPQYTSSLVFELYQNKEKQHFLKLKYLDQEYSPCANGKIMCTLDEFVKFVESKNIYDYDYRCENITAIEENQITWIAYAVIFLSVTTIILLIVVFVITRKFTKKENMDQSSNEARLLS